MYARLERRGTIHTPESGRTICNDLCEPQDLSSGHASLLLRQFVQSLQSIFYFLLPNQFLQIFL
jgi:hypothetical protein